MSARTALRESIRRAICVPRFQARQARIIWELESINARIDDLVGLITSQLPDDAFPCDEPRYTLEEVAEAFGLPPFILEYCMSPQTVRLCIGCGIPLPADAPFNRCGYCNL